MLQQGKSWRHIRPNLRADKISFTEFHHSMFFIKALFQKEDESCGVGGGDDNGGDTDHFNTKRARTQLQRCERQKGVNSSLPDTFQTNHLLFYERFKAYQDFMLGKYRPTEIPNNSP